MHRHALRSAAWPTSYWVAETTWDPTAERSVLVDDGTCLAESGAILYHLAQGSPWWPDAPIDRARALQWMFFEQYSHEPYVAVLKFWTYWGGLERARPDDVERWRTRGQAAIDVMEAHLATRAFFVADRCTIADLALYA